MKCDKCNTDNRPEAIFCKHCGEKLQPAAKGAGGAQLVDPFADLIGHSGLKQQLHEYIQRAVRLKNSGLLQRLSCNTIIMGASGTGKNLIADKICKVLYANGLIKKPLAEKVDAARWDLFVKEWQDNVKKLDEGVLIIDNVQKLVKENDITDVGQLDLLFSEMDQWKGNPIVILLGLPKGFREFLDNSPEVRRKFDFVFRLDEYSAEELTAICLQQLMQRYRLSVGNDSFGKLERVIKHSLRNKSVSWGNAHEVIRMAKEIHERNAISRADSVILPQDIVGEEEREESAEEILAKLDDFVGIDNIRTEILNMISDIEADKERSGKAPQISSHFVFTGNPGTGKTTIARVFADILKAMKVLPIGHLVEADRSKLVGKYVGTTAVQTNELVDRAMGGVLFIDEAYTLVNDAGNNAGYGQEAIDTLLKRLEDDRGKFVCIVAGYTKEMFDFLQSNPGMQSRFNKTIEFKDYNGAELTEMFHRRVAKEGFTLDRAADANLRNFFDQMYALRTKNFGNAREVRNAFQEAKNRQSARLRKLKATNPHGYDRAMLSVLTRDDIEGDENMRELNLDDVMAQMEREFVGMQSVKDAMRSIGKKMTAIRRRMELGVGDAKALGIHIMLTGNPGTGKTTVARTLGRMLKAVKVLPTDNVIEVDKSQMVASTVGSTPDTVNKLVDRAMGGILFVDEAYTLSQDANSGVGYGKEAIETLMKRMEDDRGKFVCILAGYRKEMDEFMRVNPGIESRITHRLHIEDYTSDELLLIFKNMVKKEKLHLTPEAEEAAHRAVGEMVAAKGKNFGNAREMRKLLDNVLDLQSNRLDTLGDALTAELLTTIEATDIPVEKRKDIDSDAILSKLDDLVGLQSVKDEIRNLANYLNLEKMRAEAMGKKFEGARDHYLFLGNPGTGKTTVARIMADVFLSLGVTKNTKFVEATYDTLVSKYRGETPEQTNRVIDSAMGGILFIDEAYTLNEGPNSPGQQAIDTLLKRLEDDRGKFVCIAAGYSYEMNGFIATNSGLQSRFNKTITFEDYDPGALAEIFRRKAKAENFVMGTEAEDAMCALFHKLYDHRNRNFGNAREVNNVFRQVKERQGSRIISMMQGGIRPMPTDLLTFIPEDFDI